MKPKCIKEECPPSLLWYSSQFLDCQKSSKLIAFGEPAPRLSIKSDRVTKQSYTSKKTEQPFRQWANLCIYIYIDRQFCIYIQPSLIFFPVAQFLISSSQWKGIPCPSRHFYPKNIKGRPFVVQNVFFFVLCYLIHLLRVLTSRSIKLYIAL